MKIKAKSKALAILLLLTLAIASFPAVLAVETTNDFKITTARIAQPLKGTGTEADPYQISSAEELIWFAENVNSGNTDICAKVMNNIDLNNAEWAPIGNDSYPYTGTFDGGEFIVSNFCVTAEKNNQGFFGYCKDADIKNIITENGKISGKGSLGGIVGKAERGSITNCINGSTISSTGSSNGGIVGICNNTQIISCVNNGDILQGAYQNGGIVGSATTSLIDCCINYGDISNTDHTGGIVAYNDNGTVSNCVNYGDIKTTGPFYCYTAGIVANNRYSDSVVKNCLNLGSLSGTNGQGCKISAIVCATDNGGNNADNCYSLEGLGDLGFANNSELVTEEQLKSGYVTWMLNEQNSKGVWKQTIGTDNYPNFSGDVVYKLGDGTFGAVCDHVLSTNKQNCMKDAICSVCGEKLPATGHSYGEPVWSWSEDGKSATVTFTCKNDSTHEETPDVTVTSKEETPATCTDQGITTYIATVTFGGKEYIQTKNVMDLPALDHDLSEWQTIIAPTCTEKGSEKRTCSRCDYFETREVEPLGHDWEEEFFVDKEATCTEDGSKSIHCKNCDVQKESTVIPAIGHSYTDGKCTVCNAVDPNFKPIITAGANGIWIKTGRDGLSFTSNAAFADFIKVQVDGKDVDVQYYEAKEGSTIIILKSSYLENLPIGKHTLSIVSNTGIAATEFTVKAESGDVQTGDSGNAALWIVLLLVLGLFGIAVYGRKKKYNQ